MVVATRLSIHRVVYYEQATSIYNYINVHVLPNTYVAGGPSLTAPVTNGATGSKGRLCEEGKRRRREGEGGGSRNFSCPHFLQPLPEKGETLAYVGGVGLLPKSGGRENRVVGFSSLPKPRFKARREERSIFPTHWRDRQLLFLLCLFPTGQEAPNERLKTNEEEAFPCLPSPLLSFPFIRESGAA